jgi:putative molybdopterin biosynthesis protein
MKTFLNTEEAAAHLGIKERKLYELIAEGAIPCSKVTGKWLFPRAALDRWVEAGLIRPPGLRDASPPAIIGGSHDPLLEWAARRSGSGLALLSEGSGAGLLRLERNEIAVAAVHLHAAGVDDANEAGVLAAHGLHDAVLIAFAEREQGLMAMQDDPRSLSNVEAAVRSGARFGLRQGGAGAQLLLDKLLAEGGRAASEVASAADVFATGSDLAAAIRAGDVDCGIGSRAVALAAGLSFVPLATERFDLAMRRRTYFEAGPQKMFALMRSHEFRRRAESLGGYDVGRAGEVRLNR